MEQRALEYLVKNPLLHQSMLSPIQRKTASILFADEEGVLLLEQKSQAYMLSADTAEKGAALLSMIPDSARLFCFHQHFSAEPIQKRFGLPTLLRCYQAVYEKKEPIPIPSNFSYAPLTLAHLEDVAARYQHYVDKDYLAERIREGALFGAFDRGAFCAFAGMHAEGCMGMMEVFPAHRRRGIGFALGSFLVNWVLGQGQVPFAQVGVDNEASLGLQRKMGMSISNEPMYWLF